MKTRITALLIMLKVIALLSACSAGTHSDLEVTGKPDLPYSFSESKSSESSTKSENTNVSAILEETADVNSDVKESGTSIQASTTSESGSISSTQEQPRSKPSSTTPPKAEASSELKPLPPQEPKSNSTDEPTQESTAKLTQQPSFDIGFWVSYAQSYAQGKGLSLDSSATECWDNPISAGVNCTSTESNIISRINRYAKDEDITDVWIWAESTGNGNYDLYIGYA